MGLVFQNSVWYVRRAQTPKHLVLKDLACEQEILHTCSDSFLWLYPTHYSQIQPTVEDNQKSFCHWHPVDSALWDERCLSQRRTSGSVLVQHVPGDVSYLNLSRDKAAIICLPTLPLQSATSQHWPQELLQSPLGANVWPARVRQLRAEEQGGKLPLTVLVQPTRSCK